MRAVVRSILRRHGYDVLEARSPEEALSLCEAAPGAFDSLLTDIVMPRMSGPELVAAHRRAPARASACSSCRATPTTTRPLRRSTSNVAFLQKPITPESLDAEGPRGARRSRCARSSRSLARASGPIEVGLGRSGARALSPLCIHPRENTTAPSGCAGRSALFGHPPMASGTRQRFVGAAGGTRTRASSTLTSRGVVAIVENIPPSNSSGARTLGPGSLGHNALESTNMGERVFPTHHLARPCDLPSGRGSGKAPSASGCLATSSLHEPPKPFALLFLLWTSLHAAALLARRLIADALSAVFHMLDEADSAPRS